ncbi:MAG: hypothetical protein CVU12_08595 [Bacteroidetes bacterium HGW-Bacteroidetes-7]|jgi:hypothetical protein|nr:MAG: hypothetical protein CVU12_08595 [Bacteroidetes bacterium HGW-Bacteroidetes-7]
MESPFFLELKDFILELGVEFTVEKNFIFFSDLPFVIEARGLFDNIGIIENRVGTTFPDNKYCRVDEDLWNSKGEIIKDIIKANLQKGERIFARKCSVVNLDAQTANDFFEKHHLLSNARSKYRYGLVYNSQIVAAAAFSESRPMKRDDATLESYEWVRYASKGSARVSGGMGKLLSHFVNEQKPQEIMSYADADWSLGDAYEKLGFKKTGATAPVQFLVNKHTFERIPLKKLSNDNKYKSVEFNQDDWILLLNSGNLKFLRSFSLL